MSTLTRVKPSLAFAGVGWIGRNRMQAAANTQLADILLISDVAEQCLTEALKIAPDSKTCSSFEEILTNPEIDGIVIATPSALHKDQAILAFEHGKAVFCQKPLGRNAAEVKAVVDASRNANKLLGGDFSYRYTAAFQKIKPIIQSGELGKIFAVELKFHNAYGPDKLWFYDMKQAGGGCVLDLGIHLVDMMMYAMDFPVIKEVQSNLYAKGVAVKGKDIVEDYADVLLSFEDDINARLACSWNLQAGCEAVIEASFYGTKGGVSLKSVNGSFYDFTATRYWGTRSETLVNPPDDWGGRALIHWIERLSVDPSFNDEANQYVPSAIILDRIYGRL